MNDAMSMQKILEKNGYRTSMYVTNDDTTMNRMLSVLFNLAMSTWSDPKITKIWVYYAGHGTQIPDKDGDETDHLEEALVPSDCSSSGVITDDQLYRILQCFNPTCSVSMFFDCCHSGSICDLPYSYDTGTPVKVKTRKMALRGSVRMLSGCRDHQTVGETSGLVVSNQINGAATAALSESQLGVWKAIVQYGPFKGRFMK